MCQTNVYIEEKGEEKLLIKDCILIEETPEGLKMQSFFDNPKIYKTKIKLIDFLKKKILVYPE
jgi:predicted RNA-binding protein